MLSDAFPKLRESNFVCFLHGFYRSAAYPALIALIMACSEIFALELYTYWLYLLLGGAALLFDSDTLAIVPIACCGYMTVAAQNNPGKFPSATVFANPAFLVQFIFIVCVAALLLLARLITKLIGGGRRRAPRLTVGFLLLGAAYILAGAFSSYYGVRTALFGLIQIISLSALYFYFFFTVDWETAGKGYLPAVFVSVGVGLLMQIADMNLGVLGTENFSRSMLYTGWGIYNNVGGVMTMCMPAPFYFSVTCKNGWGFSALGVVFYLGVLFTQSRSAILVGALMLCICGVFVIVKSARRDKWKHIAVFAAVLFAVGVLYCALRGTFLEFFEKLIDAGMNDSGRYKIWEACWEKFRSFPIFGVGFYETPGGLLTDNGVISYTPDGSFMPARAHNTFFQLAATGGVVALLCYLLHRIQTVLLVLRRPTKEKTVMGFCILALLLASLLDCHFFNFGPGLLYGVLLVFIENAKRQSTGRRLFEKPLRR